MRTSRKTLSILAVVFLIFIFLGSALVFSQYNFLNFTPKPQAELVQDSVIADMISEINESEILNTAYSLQNFTTRVYGYPGNSQAAAYLYSKLDAIPGLIVEYQSSYKNVIATLPGNDSVVYMVGVHYDSTSSDPTRAPGATDNGAGCAIVMEFARVMSHYEFNHTLKFAFWNYEEGGAIGSNAYVNYINADHVNLALYHNFDSAAYDPNGQFSLDIDFNSRSSWVSDMLTQHNSLYSINFGLTYNGHTCLSDHRPFWSSGYTATTTHSNAGPNNGHSPDAHTPYDTINEVSLAYAKKNGQLVMSVLAKLAGIQNSGSSIPGDINGDGFVDVSDAALMGIWWHQTVPPAPANVDINGDGIIDISDAAIIGINWLRHA